MHRTLTDRNQAVPDEPAYSIAEVLRLKSEGLTHSQIADRFGISSTRVWQFVKHERERILSEGRAVAIRREISAGNDLDKKLPLADLFCVLNLSKRAEAVLRGHLTQQEVTEFSLRDMMDFLIPIVDDATGSSRSGDQSDFEEHYRHIPAYRVKMLGQIIYANMIKAMSSADCGEGFLAEWSARKDMLREYLVRTKGFYPYLLHGKDTALASHPIAPRVPRVPYGRRTTGGLILSSLVVAIRGRFKNDTRRD